MQSRSPPAEHGVGGSPGARTTCLAPDSVLLQARSPAVPPTTFIKILTTVFRLAQSLLLI
jgi:hypothetical protein